MMPSLKALGFLGSLPRFLSKPFRRRFAGDGSGLAPLPPAEERVEAPANVTACRVGGPSTDECR